MTPKNRALKYIRLLAAQNIITRDELNAAFTEGKEVIAPSTAMSQKSNLTEILCYIGGAIVFLGIIILFSQHWNSLNSITKILLTFGSGVAAYFAALMFNQKELTSTVSSAFYLISALLLPTGLYVIFDLTGLNIESAGLETFIASMLFGTYFASYFMFQKNILLLFSIIFGTWFYYAFLAFIINGSMAADKIFEYATLAAGLAYVLLGFSFLHGQQKPLTGFLYSFGILGFLGAALALSGYQPHQNLTWELIFPFLAFGALFASIPCKSKALLTWGTLFLIIYIIKITSEYFSKTFSWPLALVIAGLAIIGIGYLALHTKKYLINKVGL